MPEKSPHEVKVAAILKSQLKLKGVTYAELADRLNKMGFNEKPENIGNKLSRGKFSAVFMVQCLEAIGVDELRL